MSGKTYKSILYHIVFHTKNGEPYLQDSINEQVYHFIWNKVKELKCYLHRIGGTQNHVHLLIYIPPKYTVSEIIGKIKGASSYFVNKELLGDDILYWQNGYGVFTVSNKDFNKIYNYIKNQKKHHSDKTVIDEYELISIKE